MPRYIDADLLMRKVNSKYIGRVTLDSYKYGYNSAILEIELDIEDIPTADVEPVQHGHWIPNTNGGHDCSRCHADLWYDGVPIKTNQLQYCPHCGAKMDGGDSRED